MFRRTSTVSDSRLVTSYLHAAPVVARVADPIDCCAAPPAGSNAGSSRCASSDLTFVCRVVGEDGSDLDSQRSLGLLEQRLQLRPNELRNGAGSGLVWMRTIALHQ